MKNWKQTNYKTTSPYKRYYANADWDNTFNEIKPEKVKYQFKEMFNNIKNRYLDRGYLTVNEAKAIRRCYEDQQPNPSYGVSARSFRGISRVVGQGVY